MPDYHHDSAEDLIHDIDSMARATSTWVRQQAMEQRFLGLPVTVAEESALAAGFLAGIRVRLGLGDSESTLLAYAYALMRGERLGATRTAMELRRQDDAAGRSCAGFLHGLSAARRIAGEHYDGCSQPPPLSGSALSDGIN